MKNEISSNSEPSSKIDYNLINQDSIIIKEALTYISEYRMLLTKKRNLKFYFRILSVIILSSLYYTLILSMDQEIELVTAKIFHSIIICILTFLDHNLLENSLKKSQNQDGQNYQLLSDKLFIKGYEESHECGMLEIDNNYDEIDKKEMYFYNVIYGMLSFTSELLLYYFLSLSINFNVNIGTMYSLTVVEYLILVLRIPYFNIKLGFFQIVGVITTLILTFILFILYIPDYNVIVIIFTSITVSVFKFIQYCIFEYIHSKTKNAMKLIRQSSYVDGMIALSILFFIFTSKHSNLLIQDLNNLMKVILASFSYYFAMKIALHKERHYFNFVVFSSLNFIFISLFDFIFNHRIFSNLEIMLVTLISFSSIISFIHDGSFKEGMNDIIMNKKEK